MAEPTMFRMKTAPTHEAMQFTGGRKSANEIVSWIKSMGYKAEWKMGTRNKDNASANDMEHVRLHVSFSGNDEDQVFVGEWVFVEDDTMLYISVLSDEAINKEYEKVTVVDEDLEVKEMVIANG